MYLIREIRSINLITFVWSGSPIMWHGLHILCKDVVIDFAYLIIAYTYMSVCTVEYKLDILHSVVKKVFFYIS
jgi:hypothetical protein